jgi:hypothetical protein
MNKLRKQSSTTYPQSFFMADSSDHVRGKTGLSPTVTLSKNGGSFAAASGAVTEIGNGWYSLAGNATDRNTLGEQLLHAEASGADDFDGQYSIVSYDPFADVNTMKTVTDKFNTMITDIEGDYLFNAFALANAYYWLDQSSSILQKLNSTLESDGDVYRFTENALEQAPSSGGSAPTVEEIRQEMDSNSEKLAAILEDTGTTIPALINASSGAGAISHTYTLTDSDDGNPIDGAEVWVTTDVAGVNVIASGTTNSSGIVTFMLDAGTYYFWRKRSGYNFVNPDLETVKGDL